MEGSENQDQELYKRAKRRVEAIKGFYAHLSSFLIVNAGLAAVNLLTSPEYLWFLWVLFGWGIGIVSHGISVFGLGGMFNEDWEKKKIDEYMNKYKETNK